MKNIGIIVVVVVVGLVATSFTDGRCYKFTSISNDGRYDDYQVCVKSNDVCQLTSFTCGWNNGEELIKVFYGDIPTDTINAYEGSNTKEIVWIDENRTIMFLNSQFITNSIDSISSIVNQDNNQELIVSIFANSSIKIDFINQVHTELNDANIFKVIYNGKLDTTRTLIDVEE